MNASLTAWLMVGQSVSKKRERRARWLAEVVEPGGSLDEQVARARAVFQSELDEDRA